MPKLTTSISADTWEINSEPSELLSRKPNSKRREEPLKIPTLKEKKPWKNSTSVTHKDRVMLLEVVILLLKRSKNGENSQ